MPSPTPIRVLLVEDDDGYALIVTSRLARVQPPMVVRRVATLADAVAALQSDPIDAILLDLGLPDSFGMETVEKTTSAAGEIPIIVLTSHDDDADALQAVHRGAQDYLLKDEADGELLTRAIRYAIERAGFQRTLKERESRFRALVENSSDAITLFDEHFVALYNSQAVERVCGYTPEELQGKPMQTLAYPEDLPEVQRRFAECLANPGRPVHVEYRFRRKDGAVRWGEAVVVNRLDDPAVGAVVANHHDITERREAEAELKRRKRYFRALTEQSSDLVVVLSTGGLVLYESPAIQRILGYAYGELTGTSVLDLVHPDDRERAAGLFATWPDGIDTAGSFEFRVRHTSGEWRVFEALGRSLYDDPSNGTLLSKLGFLSSQLGPQPDRRHSPERTAEAGPMALEPAFSDHFRSRRSVGRHTPNLDSIREPAEVSFRSERRSPAFSTT